MSKSGRTPRSDLARTWIELQYAYASGQPIDQYLWALDAMDALRETNPHSFLHLVLEIFSYDSSPLVTGNLAAGPLEDVLAQHGRAIIDEIERLATKDDRIRTLFGHIWRNVIDEDVWQRIQRLVVQQH